MPESISSAPSAISMRRKASERRAKGWVRNSFWLSPEAIETLEQVRETMGLSSREAVINAMLERIRDDMFLKQEFLAVTK